MGDVKGFVKYSREEFLKQPPEARVKHWNEFIQTLSEEDLKKQGARCMDCGVPFCHWGCPIANLIPDWNDLVFRGQWNDAWQRLQKTNNFPEFTGRVCPAPCEHSCTLGINRPAVTIKNIEVSIIEKAYEMGWVIPCPPKNRTGKKVAVVGSGPAGLACADPLNRTGHWVSVYEKNEVVGGLLRLGIPDYKLEKFIVERRIERMQKEGIVFKTKSHVGVNVDPHQLMKEFDAVVLTGGAEQPRDLPVPGRELKGTYFAMDFLAQQNRINRGEIIPEAERISAQGKKVLVIGGGDTGSDCIGTSIRQGAISVRQFELLPKPPVEREMDNPWPYWAFTYRKSTSHEEGVETDFSVMTRKFTGEKGVVKKAHAIRLEYGPKDLKTGRRPMKEIAGSEFEVDADLILLAMGFLGPVKTGMIQSLGIALDDRGNVKTDNNRMTNVKKVFAAGDMRRGQSLVVWAIYEGRSTAERVHEFLSRDS